MFSLVVAFVTLLLTRQLHHLLRFISTFLQQRNLPQMFALLMELYARGRLLICSGGHFAKATFSRGLCSIS